MTDGSFRYARGPLTADYIRAGGGIVLTAGPVLALDLATWVAAALGGAAFLFLLFALRTAQRNATRVEVDDDGIRTVVGPREGPPGEGSLGGLLGSRVEWAALRRVRLDYYSTRRDRKGGWMQMTLRGPGTIRLESTLDGFDLIAERVAEAARMRGLPLGDATVQNFSFLGIDADGGDGVRDQAKNQAKDQG
ncbi:MAG TPA: hypothetical protein VK943_03695 [Arenibaculum sp.]|nr:hypothetical protein [Arenibaculum sp.]